LWQRLVNQMREHFRNEKFSEAILDAIREIGDALARIFHEDRHRRAGCRTKVVEG